MIKIAFIGAGSLVFGMNLLTDILAFPKLTKDTLIVLEDIDDKRLDLMYRYMTKYKGDFTKELGLEGVTFEKTTRQKKAIEDAKYVISAIQVGGLEAYKVDLDIPLKYNISQNVGDTLGPGGVFRFLRTAPALQSIVEDIDKYGYNADKEMDKPLFLNYTNPMVMNTWLCNTITPDSTVGLCHGVQGTANLMRKTIGAEPEEISFLCAGINHMAWFLKFWYKNSKSPNSTWVDGYPLLHKKVEDNPEEFENMKGVRWDMMKAAGGYFMTESDGHLSEYLPYYRKRKDLMEKYKTEQDLFAELKHSAYYDINMEYLGKMEERFNKWLARDKLKLKAEPSDEYGSQIINAIETDIPFRFNGNVINKNGGLITNLPDGCCVEVPTFADSQGLHPQGGIELPTICQALCISNIMVQKAAVESVLTLDKEKAYHAVLLDPSTASICSPEEIRSMVEEMFKAEAKWLPHFK